MAKSNIFHLPILPVPVARLLGSWAAWREPPTSEEVTLNRRRIYIFPTRLGMIFFFIIFIILLGSINYNNSLGHMLAFLLGSIVFIDMIYCHQNLVGLKLTARPGTAVFAGQKSQFLIQLSDDGPNDHFALVLISQSGDQVPAWLDAQHSETLIKPPVDTVQRGYLRLERFKIYSEFPLGLFHAWSWISLDARCLVYPKAIPSAPDWHHGGQDRGHNHSTEEGTDDFAGIREYRKGDAPRHMAWKAIARSDKLYTKQFESDSGAEIWLDWFEMDAGLDIETRLSLLCSWILQADSRGLRYGLKLPEQEISANHGEKHRHQCLRALALFKHSGSTASP